MNGKLTIHDYLRAQVVERWTIINKVRRQSVAEHSWMVTVIAMYLYQQIVGFEAGIPAATDSLQLIVGALFHDAPETRTGDIPTPGKNYIRDRGRAEIFDDIDIDLMPVVPFIGGTIAPEIERFIKVADIIEAAAWLEENGVGQHARAIAEKTHARLMERVERATVETGVDWYGPVNQVLMAMGVGVLHHDQWIHQL